MNPGVTGAVAAAASRSASFAQGFSEASLSPDQCSSRLFVAWQPAEPMGGASAGRGGMGGRRGRRREAGRAGWRLRGAAGRAGEPQRAAAGAGERARGLREARAAPGAVTVSGGIVTRSRGGHRAGRGHRHRGRLSAGSARPLRRLESVAARRLQREVRGRYRGLPAPLRDVTRASTGWSARRAGSAISQRLPQDLASAPRLLQEKVIRSGPAPRLGGELATSPR